MAFRIFFFFLNFQCNAIEISHFDKLEILSLKRKKEKRNLSGGMTIRKVSSKDRLIKKEGILSHYNFPDSSDDTACQPASLILFAMTDPA